MAISLGRSLTNPFFVFAQIVNGVSLLFLLLGLSRVVISVAVLHAAWASGSVRTAASRAANDTQGRDNAAAAAGSTFGEVLESCFHVSLASLFDGPVSVRVVGSGLKADTNVMSDSSAREFFWMHVLTALGMAYPLAVSLQRRKFVLDFVLTIYGVYLVFADVVLARLLGGGSLRWWATVLCGAAVTYGATWLVCRRRELADITFSGAGGGGATSAATAMIAGGGGGGGGRLINSNTAVDGDDGDDDVEMLEVRRAAVGATSPASGMRVPSPRPQMSSIPPLDSQDTRMASFPVTAPGSAAKRKGK